MHRKWKKYLAKALVIIMLFSIIPMTSLGIDTQAAAKPKLNLAKVVINAGKTKKLTVKKVKAKNIKKTVWSAKNNKVVKLSKKKKTGVTIKGLKKGNTKVTAKIKVGNKVYTRTCNVKVNPKKVVPTKKPVTPKPVTPKPTQAVTYSLAIEKTSLTMPYNSSRTLAFTVSPQNAKVTWSSSNQNVATVSNGIVKAMDGGTTVITASIDAKDKGIIRDSCTITVVKHELGVKVVDVNFNDGNIAPWAQGGRGGTEEASVDESAGIDGSKCLRMIGRTKDWHGALIDLSDVVEPSATYKFEAYIKLADTAAAKAIAMLSTQKRAVATGDPNYANLWGVTKEKTNWQMSGTYMLTDPKEWTRAEITVATPDDISEFGLYIETGNDPNVDIMIDNSSLTLISRNEPDYSIPSLYNAYKGVFPYLGAAVDYNQLMGDNASTFVKSQFNSVTMGNEMKPTSVLPKSNTSEEFVTVDEAKKLGYYIPDSYLTSAENKRTNTTTWQEEIVLPKLRFEIVDQLLKQAHEKGFKMRYHALIWHQQMPVYFFKKNFKLADTETNCSKETMDARTEFYVRTIMEHIVKSPYADVIYSVDVVNEYLHGQNAHDPAQNGNGITFWHQIYGTQNGNTMTTEPSYVKLAFKTAYDVLVKAGKKDKISLLYNDFNTYQIPTQIVTMVNWLNSDGAKICDGVGMQAHLTFPSSPSAATFIDTVNTFTNADFEVHITELDIGFGLRVNEVTGAEPRIPTEDDYNNQAAYYKAIMKGLIEAQKSSGKVTSVTLWGLYDAISWRMEGRMRDYPLPFDGLYNIKPAFTAMIEAANESK